MRKNHRFAFLAIGGLGLLAAVAPGLAAGIQIPAADGDRPAAGQGAIDVQGFIVENINWVVNSTDPVGRVDEVTFDIYRTADCTAGDCSAATSTVASANATVRVLLNDDPDDGTSGTFNTTWVDCTVAGGAATCATASPAIEANDLQKVEVLAFDSVNR